MKKKFSKAKLLKWLKSTTGVILLSVTLGNNVSTVMTNTTSPLFLAQAMEQELVTFPKGSYIVKYEYSKDEDHQDEFPYSKAICAMAFNANTTGGGKILNLTEMLAELDTHEYVVSSSSDTAEYSLTSIFIKQPQNPLEAEELIISLNKYATFVTTKDLRDSITGTNSFINGKRFIS